MGTLSRLHEATRKLGPVISRLVATSEDKNLVGACDGAAFASERDHDKFF